MELCHCRKLDEAHFVRFRQLVETKKSTSTAPAHGVQLHSFCSVRSTTATASLTAFIFSSNDPILKSIKRIIGEQTL